MIIQSINLYNTIKYLVMIIFLKYNIYNKIPKTDITIKPITSYIGIIII